MGGHTKSERRWLMIYSQTGTNGATHRLMYIRVNEFTNPYYLVTNAAGNTDGIYMDIPDLIDLDLEGSLNQYNNNWN